MSSAKYAVDATVLAIYVRHKVRQLVNVTSGALTAPGEKPPPYQRDPPAYRAQPPSEHEAFGSEVAPSSALPWDHQDLSPDLCLPGVGVRMESARRWACGKKSSYCESRAPWVLSS